MAHISHKTTNPKPILSDETRNENALEEAKKEVERACQNAWKLYQTSPSPKSYDAEVLLFENVAEIQFVGLDDSPTVKAMQTEVKRLLNI